MEDFPELISALYQRPQADWDLQDWRTLALWLHQERKSALDGWGKTVGELEQAVANTERLKSILNEDQRRAQLMCDALKFALLTKRPSVAVKRSRGRQPKDVDAEFLLSAFANMQAEYVAANPFQKPSDPTVLTWWFQKEFASNGLRTTTVRTAKFQAKLKTLRNRLSDARNPTRKLPVK